MQDKQQVGQDRAGPRGAWRGAGQATGGGAWARLVSGRARRNGTRDGQGGMSDWRGGTYDKRMESGWYGTSSGLSGEGWKWTG